MKRSKIYLGVTTCLLAIVVVAAARAHKFSLTHFGYYGTIKCGGIGGTCLHVSVQWFTQGTNPAVSRGCAVYTRSNTGPCAAVLNHLLNQTLAGELNASLSLPEM